MNLKPQLITYDIKCQILALAKKGFHRKEIAKRAGVCMGSVEQQISTLPELVEWRKQCKHESKRRRYKLQIIKFIQQKPNSIRQEIKTECNAAFFWLYSHENQWLQLILPDAQKAVAKPRVDWHQRDLLLVKEISLLLEQHPNQLSRSQLDKILGGHGWLTKKKHKLPLTLQKYHFLNNL